MNKMNELYEKVAKDESLQTKLAKILKSTEEAGEAAVNEKLVAFAKEAGFDITVKEMKTFFKELAEKQEGELSGAEMDAVAGGKSGAIALDICMSIVSVGIGCIPGVV